MNNPENDLLAMAAESGILEPTQGTSGSRDDRAGKATKLTAMAPADSVEVKASDINSQGFKEKIGDEIARVRGMGFAYQRQARSESLRVEKEMKGFFVDWVFTRLNLTKYR